MEVDNEEIWGTFDKHAQYYSNLHSITQFLHCKGIKDKWIVEA